MNAQQKKMIVFVGAAAAGFFMLWLFVYLPLCSKIRLMRLQISEIDRQAQDIEFAMGRGRRLGDGAAFFEREWEKVRSRFPGKEEVGLEILSDLARRLGLEVISVRPEPKAVFLDADSRRTDIEGKACHRTPIAIALRCDFRGLVGFLEALKDSPFLFADIERLKITKDSLGPEKLDVTVDLNLFTLS